jgi:hypothetical protein
MGGGGMWLAMRSPVVLLSYLGLGPSVEGGMGLALESPEVFSHVGLWTDVG